ncbi:FAD/NAD(P)-binding protein [Rhodococcus sp. BS-15]|uniref:FAD/NAD(P)-binding protein n=1 Tax=Rhodococcus sp. BS-15 TaxID=1304954 RepID=UPI00165165C8|nr:FAD/NAD(P)-binding protein [Rhodococcus sp. BS-15]
MIRVAIVGFGPRGLVALERVGAHLSETDFAATIDVFDSSRSDGWGVHDPDLPEFIRLNTIASQLTVYTDAEMVFPGAPTKPGPTFYEWVRDNGQTVVEYGDERRPERTDFLPRGLIGKYLAEAAARFTTDTDRLTVKVHRYEATAVRALSTGATVRTATDSTELRYDLVIIATGHGADRSARQLELDRVPPRRRLLLRGMGLTAMDLVAHLTVGRGGRFTRDTAGIFTYHQRRGALPHSHQPIWPTARSQTRD